MRGFTVCTEERSDLRNDVEEKVARFGHYLFLFQFPDERMYLPPDFVSSLTPPLHSC